MIKYFLLMALSLVFANSTFAVSNSSMPNATTVRNLLNQGIPNGFAAKLGNQVVDKKVQLLKAKYKYSIQGGASVVLPSTFLANLVDVDNKEADLPLHAVIKQVLIDVVTTPTASASAGFSTPRLSIGINTTNDLLASTLATSLSGRVAGIPVNTPATMVETLGASAVKLYMTGGSLIGGEFNTFIEFYLSD